jgi:iron complex outermembrane receptor protein
MKALPLNPPALLCLLGLAVPLVAAAQTEIEEIVVTAQKIQESVQEIPISIKVLSAETLETTNADSLDDITRLVPSMSMAETGGRGRSNVQIRGLGSNVGSVGTTAIYNDGVIAASRIASSGTFTEQDSVLFDTDRVEVLRGPQGTLYGEGSFGGVVNIISKRPNPKEVEAAFSGSWFTIKDGGSGSNDINAMVNFPLIQDRLAVRLVGVRNDHEGYIDGYDILPTFLEILSGGDPSSAPPTLIGRDLNTEKVTGGRLSIGYTGESTSATLILKRQDTSIGLAGLETDFFDIMQDYAPHGREASAAFIGPDALVPSYAGKVEADEAVLEFNAQTGHGTWTSLTGYGRNDVNSIGGGASDNKAWSQELRFSTDRDEPINWTAGAFYRTAEIDEDFGGVPINHEEIDQWSVFGQMYWDINTTVRATFGLRYGEQDTLVIDRANEPQIADAARAEGKFDDLSPKLALDWRVREETLLYASMAKGYRAGGANVDSSLGQDPDFTRAFKADSIINYEVGAKTTLMDRKLTINTAVFFIDWSDIQVDRPIEDNITGNPEGVFIVTNGKNAHSYGVEADVYITPAEGWEMVLGGSLLNAEYDDGTIDSPYEGGRTFELKGIRLPSAPEYVYNASLTRTFPLGSSKLEGFFRGDYSVRGNSFSDVPNRAIGTDFFSGRLEVINLRAGIRGGKWEAQAFVLNLADHDDSTFDYDQNSPTNFLFRSRLQPRTVGVNVKLNF